MNAHFSPTRINASLDGEKPFPQNAKVFPVLTKISNAIKAAWPRKTAACVAHLTGVEERTVKFWLAGETRMSVESIGALLRTEEGFSILEAIMGDSQAKWWLIAQIAQERRKNTAAIKKIEARTAHLKAQMSLLDE